MVERFKNALVESFVGAIAVGWIFAQGIYHFAFMFVAPVAGWLSRREYRGIMGQTGNVPGFSLQDALPELAKSVCLLLAGYVLLRWLYYKRPQTQTSGTSTTDLSS